MTIPQALQTALQYHQSGRLAEAETLYRQILAVQPHHADALHLQGVIADQRGRSDGAVDLIRRAIILQPHVAAYYCNLGEAYRKLGRLDEAIATYRRAIELEPGLADTPNNLGSALKAQGRLDEAVAAYRRAIELRPGFAAAHSNLGIALADQGCLDEAIAAYRQAIQHQPDFAEAHSNLGNALWAQGQIAAAIAAYRRAIELQPVLAELQNNLGNALQAQGQLDAAFAAYRRAIELQPAYAEAHWNSACLLLLRGDFEHGWPLFESRWKVNDFKRWQRNFPQPMWQGEALHGQRVLLHAEQGLGDTLQFVRYAPLVAQRGGRVIVECQPALKTLLASVDGIAQIIALGEPLPAFDLHCPMMSLPLAFGTRLETIPANIPYLRADPPKVVRWRERLEQETYPADAADPLVPSVPLVPSRPSPLKVGLVWAAGERPLQPKRRAIQLRQFAPLAEVPGVVFVSLQKGEPATEAKTPPQGMRLLDWTDELEDFADTAALVEALDLVISVDTAVAHLTGALGKPLWVLSRFDACWRWLVEREDSPWYPTMRLFRQPRFLEWEPVLARVREQLALLAATHVRK